jgi:hypothetical protein
LNRGSINIDYDNRRIHRDTFWKGSFARDTLLGWEERLRNSPLSGKEQQSAGRYTGGSFWKKFDRMGDGKVIGNVVNYDLQCVPGRPMVRQLKYPDSNRRFVKAGEDVLLLTYANPPYQKIYDVIKVIDEDDCIGVMHVGEFPAGIEFATFVMSRHNYPFANMSVPDHRAISAGDRARIPASDELSGEWQGRIVFVTRPDISLLNQLNPVAFRVRFLPTPSGVEARFRFGPGIDDSVQWTEEFARQADDEGIQDELRIVDGKTVLGLWSLPMATPWLSSTVLRSALNGYLELHPDRLLLHYVLERV